MVLYFKKGNIESFRENGVPGTTQFIKPKKLHINQNNLFLFVHNYTWITNVSKPVNNIILWTDLQSCAGCLF